MTEWDVKKLSILRTLRDHGTVTATAEALLMTPSAVSQQLTNLARQLGVELLEPQGRRVRLTDAAHLVLRHAEAVFAQLERADAELTGYLRGEAGEVRVGAFSTAVPALVVPAVRLLRAEERPGPDVRVREAEAAQAYELLTAGEVDLALSLAAHAPTARDPRFSLFPLLADPLDVALPAAHPLADAPALRLADLAADRWIFGGSGPWSEITTAACEAAGFVPEQAHSAAGWTAILALVEAGMGIALVPRMASREQRREGVVMRVLEADQPRRHVVAAVRHGAESGPAVARVLGALTRVAESFS
ncbi:LysR family transcriptional regulator [Streptomyces bacillaris]|uniref:LysR family transcriptional regulator n=1 Tax=Streptomyces cavourensis TaxID=67258 RepID=A0AAD0VED9_9ACTN|nr:MULTISPECIES: LysR family transcriptional regulator [Streptomyces]NUW23878.1 LysR family transcriptional regulator [Streptomyces roseoviolaceus]AXI71600.1 LysR family transcriptional regulator [Streptomyces cavourensis]NUV41745.1 LysR family transcriptional regulator [Streptomyces sp. CAI-24]NUV89628.1 LysR family transcriptional regulator [Streptomyces sp. KAI-26]TQO30165.1 DNA-binding transcriptional LysR family regulator [Streptomyces cavourensis]